MSEIKEDPANGGYYTVQDLRGSDARVDFHVRGYTKDGVLLLHTRHLGEASAWLECDIWESRGATYREGI